MNAVEFVITRDDFTKLPKIFNEIKKLFSANTNKINPALLANIAEVLVKSCGIKVGGKVDPDAVSRGKLVTMFKQLGINLEKFARDTSYHPNLSRTIDAREFAEGLNIRIYPMGNRLRFSVNIIPERFLTRVDQDKRNPVSDSVKKKVDEIVKKESK